jgi:hypothetical protein
VWDTAGSVAIRLENPYRYEKEGWPTTIYSTLRSQLGVTSGHEMDNFPTTHMQFMPVDYGNPAYSSWTPADLGSNKTIWLDASASASIAQSGGALSQWCDPSETAGACSLVNGTQATPAQRPSVSSSIVGFASSSSQTLNLSASITGASTYTCWAVVKAPSFTRASLLGNSSATSSYPFTLINGGIAIASANGYASAGSWPDYTNYHVINSSSNNASSTSGFDLWVDGTRQPITAYNASPRGSTWDAIGIINGSLYSDIYVQEMFCSSAVESDETKASGRAYLRQKWGTP